MCTYPTGIEYAGIGPIQVKKEEYKTCKHISRELNMQAQTLYKLEKKRTELVHISREN